jgi:hypothetical protein
MRAVIGESIDRPPKSKTMESQTQSGVPFYQLYQLSERSLKTTRLKRTVLVRESGEGSRLLRRTEATPRQVQSGIMFLCSPALTWWTKAGELDRRSVTVHSKVD